jgi:hypothetical protein
VVYRDNDLERIVDVLYDQLVVAHESHQHMLAGAVLDVYRVLLGVADGALRRRLAADVATARRLLEDSPPSPVIRTAYRAFEESVHARPDGR